MKRFLSDGWTVFAGRHNPGWTWLDELSVLYPEKLQPVRLEIADDSSVEAAAAFVRGITPSLDIIVNNAAIGADDENPKTVFDDLNFETMKHLYDVNTLGALRVTHALTGELMRSVRKLVVNISSEAGSIGRCNRTGWYAYCMSKAALNMQSVILHNSIKERGGQVMVFHPGWMQTWMSGKLDTNATFHPSKSAADIKALIDRSEDFRAEQPIFLDHLGNIWPW